jgi:hypothetical protein
VLSHADDGEDGIGRLLRFRGHQVVDVVFGSGKVHLQGHFDCAILNLDAAAADACKMATALLERGIARRAIFHTTRGDVGSIDRIATLGSVVYRSVPTELLAAVETADPAA